MAYTWSATSISEEHFYMKANIIIISLLPLNYQITYKNSMSSSVRKTLEEIYVKIKQTSWFCVDTSFCSTFTDATPLGFVLLLTQSAGQIGTVIRSLAWSNGDKDKAKAIFTFVSEEKVGVWTCTLGLSKHSICTGRLTRIDEFLMFFQDYILSTVNLIILF